MTVSFAITADERKTIGEIIDRVTASFTKQERRKIDRQSLMMDLAATLANGCPLDLERLRDADDFNLAHDVFGISRHLDRSTGALTNCFRPRFAAPIATAA